MGSIDDDQDGIPDIAVVVSVPKASDIRRTTDGFGGKVDQSIAAITQHEKPSARSEVARPISLNINSALQICFILRC